MGRIVRRGWLASALVVVAGLATGLVAAPDGPKPGDDMTFRPTVMVHKGKAVGTGTVISSLEGETLILTACHVIDEPGPLTVDLNRFTRAQRGTRGGGACPRPPHPT